MLRRLGPLGALTFAALALPACEGLTATYVCTTEFRPALAISLADSLTGATGPFSNVVLLAVDGAYRDSLVIPTIGPMPTNNQYGIAGEHAGTLVVTVRATGYQTWVKPGVVVTKDECHVRTVELAARLARAQ